MTWVPLSSRLNNETPDQALHEGAPEHLAVPLTGWCEATFAAADDLGSDDFLVQRLAMRLRIPISVASYEHYEDGKKLLEIVGWSSKLLDIVDALLLLGRQGNFVEDERLELLRVILDEGGSAYRVTADNRGLEYRVDKTVTAAYQTAATGTSAGSSSDHLMAAWKHAYGRFPDAVRSYSEAIKAVEASAHSIIQPNHAKATLGTMINELKGARHRFRAQIPGPDTVARVEAMMRMLWEGQTSRHGGQDPTVAETIEAARMGVHLAATLVQWFSSGAVSHI